MRVPLSWLRENVDVPAGATGEDVAADLVRVGLEEEGLYGGDVTGPVVVARVLSASREPQKNGKTINWCSVDVGESEPRGIVCGAPNAVAGALVVAALPGAVLPGPFPIAARKTYGHVSDGMLCSARELGLGDEHDGIIELGALLGAAAADAAPGDDALLLLGLAEEVVEVNVTPDRGYCFSVRGLAREYAHGHGLDVATSFRDPADVTVVTPTGPGHPVALVDTAPIHDQPGCTRLVTRVVRGVDPAAPSPWWLRRRLQQSGMRPISLPVDVTNYVMLAVGQPLHAYDLAALHGALTVRRARGGERLVTLDGVDRVLDAEDLLIADGDQGSRAIGLAGVMGGRATEVGALTRDILLESARFDPVTIARTARRHKLPSEASRRFERGVDPQLQAVAAELAVRLLVEHGGGVADATATDTVAGGSGPVDIAPVEIALPADLTTRLLGVEVPVDRVVALLAQVGCAVVTDGPVLRVSPPSWRPDLAQAVDLVEEVARLNGYDAIPSVLPAAPPGRGLTAAQTGRRQVAVALAERGLVEVLSYPFVAPGRSDELGLEADDPRRRALRLANPLSDEQPYLRTNVVSTLVDVAKRNTSRGAGDVAIFEIGRVTRPRPGAPVAPRLGTAQRPSQAELAELEAAVPPQPLRVAGLLSGQADPGGWWGPGRAVEAADAIALAQLVAQVLRVPVAVAADVHAPWHPGRCAAITLADGSLVGHAGELHPRVVRALGLPERTVAFELDLDSLVAAAPPVVAAPVVSTFPPAKEDLALVVDAAVPAEQVRASMLAGLRDAGLGHLVEEVRLFDSYTGAQVPPGQRSLAFALRLRATDRTLTAADTAAVREAALAEAHRSTGAVLRT